MQLGRVVVAFVSAAFCSDRVPFTASSGRLKVPDRVAVPANDSALANGMRGSNTTMVAATAGTLRDFLMLSLCCFTIVMNLGISESRTFVCVVLKVETLLMQCSTDPNSCWLHNPGRSRTHQGWSGRCRSMSICRIRCRSVSAGDAIVCRSRNGQDGFPHLSVRMVSRAHGDVHRWELSDRSPGAADSHVAVFVYGEARNKVVAVRIGDEAFLQQLAIADSHSKIPQRDASSRLVLLHWPTASGHVADNVGYMIQFDFAFPGRPSFMDVWLEVRNTDLSNTLRIE